MTPPAKKTLSPSNVLAMQRALSLRPHTIVQLAAAGDVNVPTVRRFVQDIRTHVHIAAWAPDARGRLITPAYAWGRKKDKARPGQRFTAAQRMARFRARVQAGGEAAR